MSSPLLKSILLVFGLILSAFDLCNATAIDCDEYDWCTEDVEFLSDSKPIVVIDYQDLLNHSPSLEASIATAYGASGLGILLVSNVPNLVNKRERLLKLSRVLAHDLPSKYRSNLINAESYYSVGWSHGKEKLAKDMPDLRKASFYANPIFDDPTNGNGELISSYPAFYYPNIWPHRHESDTENESDLIIEEIGMSIDEFGIELKEAFMSLGGLIVRVGGMLSDAMDSYVSHVRKHTNYEAHTLANAIKTRHPKARLLYYFSENEYQNLMGNNESNSENEMEQNETETEMEAESMGLDNEREDSWCGWHNDHSALTGLALGMFVFCICFGFVLKMSCSPFLRCYCVCVWFVFLFKLQTNKTNLAKVWISFFSFSLQKVQN